MFFVACILLETHEYLNLNEFFENIKQKKILSGFNDFFFKFSRYKFEILNCKRI